MSIQASLSAHKAQPERAVRMRQLFVFFVPLGLSATLVTVSHLIINSTLARSAQPELVISTYALAMSLQGITERPATLLRQTCSALVRDRVSFRAMSSIAVYVFMSIVAIGLLLSYTPLGPLWFAHVLGAPKENVPMVMDAYRILIFVGLFSGIRCLYHGIIIYNKRTAWLTAGMGIRLVGMYAVAQFFLQTDRVTSGSVGAVIFLTGMIIEAIVSFLEGNSLSKKLPEKLEDHPVTRKRHVFGFYKPLLYSSVIAVFAGPAINSALGKTSDIQLAIASFAIASNLTQLVISFFSYLHQIVINFYKADRAVVLRFILVLGFIPSLLIGIIAYTPVGPLFMEHVMGVNERLMHASIHAMRVLMLLTLVFPWLDFCNGILMLRGETRVMMWSQTANVTVTLITLIACITASPGWNGVIGALAQSLGLCAELALVLVVLRLTAQQPMRPAGQAGR
ncbi:multi antimicrobial extrusion protein MatE [Paenibacillus cymbidii]|uniref:multi antimicrobial extrusion protein MatE n=1 Tax=Paenibacillus cymbidii TaxID=1639034 RepID=UPI00108151A7|nr:multi antimicrobial extrusion protein MatE [Paenibacillus cymbidii]